MPCIKNLPAVQYSALSACQQQAQDVEGNETSVAD